MTLDEFIQEPDVIDLHAEYDEALVEFLKDKEYARIRKSRKWK